MARSGFRDTIASPLVRMAGAIVDVDADGADTSSDGLLLARTTAAAASKIDAPMARGPASGRSVEVMLRQRPRSRVRNRPDTQTDVSSRLVERDEADPGTADLAAGVGRSRTAGRVRADPGRDDRRTRRLPGTPLQPAVGSRGQARRGRGRSADGFGGGLAAGPPSRDPSALSPATRRRRGDLRGLRCRRRQSYAADAEGRSGYGVHS